MLHQSPVGFSAVGSKCRVLCQEVSGFTNGTCMRELENIFLGNLEEWGCCCYVFLYQHLLLPFRVRLPCTRAGGK